jgi:hypothetical protein
MLVGATGEALELSIDAVCAADTESRPAFLGSLLSEVPRASRSLCVLQGECASVHLGSGSLDDGLPGDLILGSEGATTW